MNMDNCVPSEKFLGVFSRMRFARNVVRSLFLFRPEGMCFVWLCFPHAFIYKWFWAVYLYDKINSASVVNPSVKIIGVDVQCIFGIILDLRSNRLRIMFFPVERCSEWIQLISSWIVYGMVKLSVFILYSAVSLRAYWNSHTFYQ